MTSTPSSNALFPLGRLLITPGARDACLDASVVPGDFLARHVQGNWGELSPDDRRANDDALRTGARLFSAYAFGQAQRLWVITEAVGEDDTRATTTILLPDEY